MVLYEYKGLYLLQKAISIPKLEKVFDVLAEHCAHFLIWIFNEVDQCTDQSFCIRVTVTQIHMLKQVPYIPDKSCHSKNKSDFIIFSMLQLDFTSYSLFIWLKEKKKRCQVLYIKILESGMYIILTNLSKVTVVISFILLCLYWRSNA